MNQAKVAANAGAFLGKAGPLVLARFFTAGLTLAIPLVLARALDLAHYGTYKQLFLIAQTLGYVLPFGMAQSLYYFVPRTDERRPYFVQTLLYLSAAGLVAAGMVGVGIAPLARFFSNPALLEYRLPLAAYVAFLIGSYPLEASLTSQGKTRASALVYLVSDTLRALVMVVPCLLGFSLYGTMVAAAGLAFLRWVFTWVVMVRGSQGPWLERKLLAQQFLYAAPFGAAMALAIPQQYAHQYAVSGAVSPALFALYAVGCFQLPLVDLLYTPTSEVLMVRLGELDKQGRLREGVQAFREAASKLAYVFLPFAAFLWTAAPEFIAAMFGEKYSAATPLFRVSVLGVVLAILPMDGVLRARGQTQALFYSYLIKAVVTVPLVYVGVKFFGMLGGIGSWALAELVGKLSLFVRIPAALSTPEHRLTFRTVMPWRSLGQAAGCAVGAGVTLLLLKASVAPWSSVLPHHFLARIGVLGAASLAFALLYLAGLQMSGVRPLRLLTHFIPRSWASSRG